MSIHLCWPVGFRCFASQAGDDSPTPQSHDLEPRVQMFEAEEHGGLWSEVLQG